LRKSRNAAKEALDRSMDLDSQLSRRKTPMHGRLSIGNGFEVTVKGECLQAWLMFEKRQQLSIRSSHDRIFTGCCIICVMATMLYRYSMKHRSNMP